MRRVEIALICAAFAVPAFAQNNTAQTYNRADTFEPGKKYNCVPTADRKGWDCSEAGKSVEIKPKESEPPRQAVAEPTPAPTQSTPPPPPASPPPSQPSSRSTLPSYLTNAAASNPTPVEEPPSTVSAAAAHANAQPPVAAKPLPPPKPVASAPAPTTKTVPIKPATPKSSVAASPPPPPSRLPTKPPLPPRVTHPPVVQAASGGGEFLSLPGDHFVVEMAHAASKSEIDAVKSSTHVPNGDLYEVHLRQNGADAWLLLWGSFDTLDAARAARTTIGASAAGWPRRIAPLQAEARRVSP